VGLRKPAAMARWLNCEVFLVQPRFFCDLCRTLHKISFAKSEFTHQVLQFLTNYSARRHGTAFTKTRAFVDHITGALREPGRSRRFSASALIW
jgi:hypothetical protein